jgi:Zn-finger nucleic acid-binding protein
MKLTYIYVKRLPSGLLYLGKTVKDPFNYLGSGLKWVRTIKKNNYSIKDIETWVLDKVETEKQLKELGTYYSKLFNVVNSNLWANLKDEDGNGGTSGFSKQLRNLVNKKLSQSSKNKNKIICPHCGMIGDSSNMKAWHFDNCIKFTGKRQNEVVCPHCSKVGNVRNMKRWHFDKCPEFTGIKRESRIFSDQHKLNMKKPKSENHKKSIKLASIGKKYKILECPHCKKNVASNSAKRWHFNNCPTYTGIPYPILVCPHCLKQGSNNTMKQWHFDNCKSKKYITY